MWIHENRLCVCASNCLFCLERPQLPLFAAGLWIDNTSAWNEKQYKGDDDAADADGRGSCNHSRREPFSLCVDVAPPVQIFAMLGARQHHQTLSLRVMGNESMLFPGSRRRRTPSLPSESRFNNKALLMSITNEINLQLDEFLVYMQMDRDKCEALLFLFLYLESGWIKKKRILSILLDKSSGTNYLRWGWLSVLLS